MSTSYPMRNVRVRFSGETNIGLKRAHNEDNFLLPDEERVALVADGMGGHASGEVASKMAVETLAEHFKATTDDPERTWPYKMDRSKGYEENRLITGIKLANLRIYETAQREAGSAAWAPPSSRHVSRRQGADRRTWATAASTASATGKLEQLTEDHSLLNDYIKMKRLTRRGDRATSRTRT